MWPETLTGLIGSIVAIAGIVFTVLQGLRWYFDILKEKLRSKEAIEREKYKENILAYRDNLLTAKQVTELMKATQEVKEDITHIREETHEKNEELVKAMNKLEHNLQNFEATFTNFLVARLNQFDKTITH